MDYLGPSAIQISALLAILLLTLFMGRPDLAGEPVGTITVQEVVPAGQGNPNNFDQIFRLQITDGNIIGSDDVLPGG